MAGNTDLMQEAISAGISPVSLYGCLFTSQIGQHRARPMLLVRYSAAMLQRRSKNLS